MASWKPKKVGLLTSQRQSAADLLACECFETHGDVTVMTLASFSLNFQIKIYLWFCTSTTRFRLHFNNTFL